MFSNLYSIRSFMKINGLLPHKFFILAFFVCFCMGDAVAADVQKQTIIAAEQAGSDLSKTSHRKARRKSNAKALFVESKVNEIKERAKAAVQRKGEEISEDVPEETVEAKVETVTEIGEKLSSETAELLDSIPAGGMPKIKAVLTPKKSVSIERGGSSNPFGDVGDEAEIKVGDSGLRISVKEPQTSKNDYLRIASDALKAGQMESAIAYYKKVLAQDKNNEKAKFGLAATYHKSGQLEQARDMYIELISMDQNNWPALNNFLMLASEEAPEDALNHLKRLQKSNPEFAGIPAQISMIYMKQNKLKEAARYLGKAVALDPDNLRYQYDLALVLENLGYNGMAVKLYSRLIAAGDRGKKLPASYLKINERLAIASSKRG